MSVLGKCRWKSGSKSKQGEKSRNRKIIGLKEIKTALLERLCRKSDIKQEKYLMRRKISVKYVKGVRLRRKRMLD